MWNTFLTSNSAGMRLLRTIVQGIIGVLVANLDAITEAFSFSPMVKTLIVGLVMAILSPIMAELGKYTLNNEEIRIEPVEGDIGAIIDEDAETLE
jgi:type III secretory pathway component EscS